MRERKRHHEAGAHLKKYKGTKEDKGKGGKATKYDQGKGGQYSKGKGGNIKKIKTQQGRKGKVEEGQGKGTRAKRCSKRLREETRPEKRLRGKTRPETQTPPLHQNGSPPATALAVRENAHGPENALFLAPCRTT